MGVWCKSNLRRTPIPWAVLSIIGLFGTSNASSFSLLASDSLVALLRRLLLPLFRPRDGCNDGRLRFLNFADPADSGEFRLQRPTLAACSKSRCCVCRSCTHFVCRRMDPPYVSPPALSLADVLSDFDPFMLFISSLLCDERYVHSRDAPPAPNVPTANLAYSARSTQRRRGPRRWPPPECDQSAAFAAPPFSPWRPYQSERHMLCKSYDKTVQDIFGIIVQSS